MARKTNNPFKMIGSYFGLILGYLIAIALRITERRVACLNPDVTCDPITVATAFIPIEPNWLPILLPVGFIVGWLIHSIIRRSK